MTKLLGRLWDDDAGAVISTELILVLGILIFGLIPGLVALRNSVIASLTTIGNFLDRITPSFTYSGYAITGVGNVNTIAQVGGLRIDYATTGQLSGNQVDPEDVAFDFGFEAIVFPAP